MTGLGRFLLIRSLTYIFLMVILRFLYYPHITVEEMIPERQIIFQKAGIGHKLYDSLTDF